MGFAIAAAAARRGATSRWYQVRFHYRRHRLLNVLCDDRAGNGSRRECICTAAKFFIGCAAVADYRAATVAPEKSKSRPRRVMN